MEIRSIFFQRSPGHEQHLLFSGKEKQCSLSRKSVWIAIANSRFRQSLSRKIWAWIRQVIRGFQYPLEITSAKSAWFVMVFNVKMEELKSYAPFAPQTPRLRAGRAHRALDFAVPQKMCHPGHRACWDRSAPEHCGSPGDYPAHVWNTGSKKSSSPTIFMWKFAKNGWIGWQPEIKKPDRAGMFGSHGKGPLFWTESAIEFSLEERKSRDKSTVTGRIKESSLF